MNIQVKDNNCDAIFICQEQEECAFASKTVGCLHLVESMLINSCGSIEARADYMLKELKEMKYNVVLSK